MQPEGTPLLRTKLDVPPPQAHMLVRERLFAPLPNVPGARLVLLSAPAGFGKTTFLATWCRRLLAQRGSAVAWLSLDEADNNPARFLAYLVMSLRQALGPNEIGDIWPLPGEATRASYEAVLARLVNALAASDRDIVLVFDDYHLISAPAVHSAVAFLLEHMPQRACVALGSRADPPLPVARLRAHDRLVELRAADLRFTPDEVRACLAAADLALSAEEAQAVGAYTEGWPAGVRLVALALRDQNRDRAAGAEGQPLGVPAGSVIERLAGGQQHIFAYLADDVFEREPSHRKAFLLQTAILDRLCGPLCDAILGVGSWEMGDRGVRAHTNPQLPTPNPPDSYSRLILEELEHANLFVVPLGGEPRWYRYHQLFRAFLRARLEREPSLAVADLHRRASAWYEQHALIDQAREHALAAGEHTRAAALASAQHARAGAGSAEIQSSAGQSLPRQSAIAEPLSERETEVLRLIARGASNQAIAATLVISIGTVKSHINHILGKLGACNRTEAVSRARELELLAF